MIKKLQLRLQPSEAADPEQIRKMISAVSGKKITSVTGYHFLKRSIDARGRQVYINLTLEAFLDEPFQNPPAIGFTFPDVSKAGKRVIIIGAGPAGLFAALRLIELGIRPILLERGKDVRARRRDLALLNKEGIINPESNYCFGEGGAGTYSDGKLYTRSTKRGDVTRILHGLVYFGADKNILYESHPHVGTNKLPGIITAIRKKILDCGGEFHFDKKVTGFILSDSSIRKVITADGNSFEGDVVILATGHSARDIFELLHSKKILIHFKPFALGVRVEHPQSLIDTVQYHCSIRDENLPPSSYSLVQQTAWKAVFSFCMCPGGIIAPAATNDGEIVVNGWSPSKRNNPFANSGIVVPVEEEDVAAYTAYGALAGIHFQQQVEQKAFKAGGGKMTAPAQRLVDFCQNKFSSGLPDCSYLPGTQPGLLSDLLPSYIYQSLKAGFIEFGKKMKGYLTNEALVLATESRTSSPVRIPREKETLVHPQVKNLYPCGEGAGYAGGIISAALDGVNVANAISEKILSRL